MKALAIAVCGTLIALIAALSGCDSGSDSLAIGIGGTGKIASGSITRFGSIFVNGVEYDIDTASCSVDGSDVTGNCQANLSLGMVVTVEGSVTSNQGSATSVVFSAYADGPVSLLTTQPDGLTSTFSILGIPVVVDTATTRFDDSGSGFDFAALSEGNVVKVSGFLDASGVLQASYISKLADTTVPGSTGAKLKGRVADLNGAGNLPGDTFTLNGTTVSIRPDTDLTGLSPNPLADGNDVEVSGIVTGAASVDAGRIETLNTRIGEEGDEVSIEGLVSGFTGDPASFMVDGQPVDASTAQITPSGLQLANGLKVEAEGVIQNGILVASEIEGRGDDIKIDATVTARSASTLTVLLGFEPGTLAPGRITVNVDSRTTIEDSTGSLDNPSLADINPGDFVQIRGFRDDAGITADEIHRESSDDVRLQGPVESFEIGTSITVLGVTFFTDSGTQFEDGDDNPLGSAGFYGALAIGDTIKIEDRQPGDGTADEIDQED